MNENAASLQPADYWLSGSPREGQLHVHVYVFYIVYTLTKRHADDMLRAVYVKQQVLVPPIHLYQEITINKKN